MSETVPAPRAVPVTFWIFGAIAAAVTVAGAVLVEPPQTLAVEPAMGWLLAALGAYFVACSTFFQRFVLYALQVERAVAWYGERSRAFTHGFYRLLGFVMLAAGLLKVMGKF